jgi:peptidoglycan/xylan/chitin deacetylase (PgdA/CDA1 family)
MRFFKFPKWSKRFYPNAIWDFSHLDQRSIYLTFDDGPHIETTTALLNLLDKYEAKATFFCLGKNAERFPQLMKDIIQRGHTIGNHGMDHLKGWNTTTDTYLQDVQAAAEIIPSNYFRPAYGKMKRKQAKAIAKLGYKLVFWTVMSYDFDHQLTSEKRIAKLKKLTKPGAIYVFHDSDKVTDKFISDLEIMLMYWKEKGYTFRSFDA